MHIKLSADVTATDTTQARVTQHDIGNIESSYFWILLRYTIKTPKTAFTRKLALMANKKSNSLYSETVTLKIKFQHHFAHYECQF